MLNCYFIACPLQVILDSLEAQVSEASLDQMDPKEITDSRGFLVYLDARVQHI